VEDAPVEVTRELVLDAPPEEVWEALTDARQLEEWFANEVELTAERGGTGRFSWDDGEVRRALVEEVEVGRRLVFRWRAEEAPLEETRVEFVLEDVPAGTRLIVTETARVRGAAAFEWAFAFELRALAQVPLAAAR
jgi:uncharacterized protein YndB with AHSA1/START domain